MVQLILFAPTFKIQDIQNNVLMEQAYYDYNVNVDGFMKIILKLASSVLKTGRYEDHLDKITMALLSLIITCVCAPYHKVCNFIFIMTQLFISILYILFILLILYF